ncbi:MAG: hypothetical protein QM820_29750 [Minicystis sp.]
MRRADVASKRNVVAGPLVTERWRVLGREEVAVGVERGVQARGVR